MNMVIDNNNKTYTERLSFDARNNGGFARWDIEFTAPNRKGEQMHLSITSGHPISASFQAW